MINPLFLPPYVQYQLVEVGKAINPRVEERHKRLSPSLKSSARRVQIGGGREKEKKRKGRGREGGEKRKEEKRKGKRRQGKGEKRGREETRRERNKMQEKII